MESGSDKPIWARQAIVPVVAIICLSLDYWAKLWARQHLPLHESRPFLPGILNLTLTTNTGAAFSIGSENGLIMTLLASAITLAMVVWLVIRTIKKEQIPVVELIGLGCLLGGALGNLFDRFRLGRVTDFLEFAFVTFPVFNLADVFIDIGLGLIILATLSRQSDSASEPAKEEPDRQDESEAEGANREDV